MLPIKLLPHKYELVSSWLTRLAFSNGTDLDSISKKIFNDSRLLYKDIDKFLSDEELTKIALVTDIKKDIINEHTLHFLFSKVSFKNLIIKAKWKWVIPNKTIYKSKSTGTQFCPTCLKEEQKYFLIYTRISWNFACIKHKTLLLKKCPRCEKGLNYQINTNFKDIYLCKNCNYNFLENESVKVSEEALELQSYLNDCLVNGHIVDSNFFTIDKNIKELFYTIRILFKFLIRIKNKNKLINSFLDEFNTFKEFSFNRTNSFSIDKIDIRYKANVFHNLSLILKTNIKYFENFLISNKITYRQFIGSNIETPHSKTIRSLIKNLKIRESTPFLHKKKMTIVPKSKNEVDSLMYEIESLL